MGPWLLELQGHIQDNIAGKSPVKYYHKLVSFQFVYAVLIAITVSHTMGQSLPSLALSRSAMYVPSSSTLRLLYQNAAVSLMSLRPHPSAY